MRREQLEPAIRTACQIIGHSAVIVIGSQATLGTYGEDELPAAATMPIADSNEETARLADLIDGGVIAARLGLVPDKHLPATERALSGLTPTEWVRRDPPQNATPILHEHTRPFQYVCDCDSLTGDHYDEVLESTYEPRGRSDSHPRRAGDPVCRKSQPHVWLTTVE